MIGCVTCNLHRSFTTKPQPMRPCATLSDNQTSRSASMPPTSRLKTAFYAQPISARNFAKQARQIIFTANQSTTPMYQYNVFDAAFIAERNAQFRTQVARRINGALTEDEFKPLRLMNGVYLQLHAYMLRVAIPYGTLNSAQMTALASIAEKWDKGYGHFTTRQNIQFNWPSLSDIPDILDTLASVE